MTATDVEIDETLRAQIDEVFPCHVNECADAATWMAVLDCGHDILSCDKHRAELVQWVAERVILVCLQAGHPKLKVMIAKWVPL